MKIKPLLIVALLLSTISVAKADDGDNAVVGALLGGILGGVVTESPEGAIIGAVGGAIVGNAVGKDDNRYSRYNEPHYYREHHHHYYPRWNNDRWGYRAYRCEWRHDWAYNQQIQVCYYR